ncbi:hypothetical protein ACI2K4_17895 [Micromonospora sp. NPDC050397]|uniref:hypothetical protein n=1 Tax=Micromonospora sp. NPDC050397 TaxID=3364279 RepID=UPI00384F2339
MSTSLPPLGRGRPGSGHPRPPIRRPPPPAAGWRPATAATRRARLVALAVLGCLALSSGAGLAAGLVSCTPAAPTDPARALTTAEAGRLAAMRMVNYRHGRVGVRATLGGASAQIQLAGAVDWHRKLAYLSVSGPGAGSQRGLLQAVPGLVLTRPDPAPADPARIGGGPGPATLSTPAPPPETPPTDGWRVRRLVSGGPVPAAVDSFLTLLFTVAADRPDPTEPLLARDTARWLGRDRADGVGVDVLLGPAMPAGGAPGPVAEPSAERTLPVPATPAGLSGGAVRYWLDGDGRLHRFEAMLAGDVPMEVDLDLTGLPELPEVAALGGPAVRARAITGDEAELLARVRSANRELGGAEIGLTVPTQPLAELPAANLRAAGWVDWSTSVAYLAVHELDRPGERTLLRAGRSGVAARDVPAPASPGTATAAPGDGDGQPTAGGASPSALTAGASLSGPTTDGSPSRSVAAAAAIRPVGAVPPPLPPPRDRNWAYSSWQQRTDALGAADLDLLVNEVLAIGSAGLGTATRLRESASWLRRDSLDGRQLAVFEIPKEAEASVERGQARMRYWVDPDGLLRRLELRTRIGAFAQLDLAPGSVPELPGVPVD